MIMVNVVILFVGSSAYTALYCGGIGPIHLDNVGCRGSEQHLIDCPHTNNTPGWDCTHREDASVHCQPSIKSYYHSRKLWQGFNLAFWQIFKAHQI